VAIGVAYESSGVQTSNTQGDAEVYRMSAVDGSANKNLTNNGLDAEDYDHDWGRQTM
jgi:hypothetical protein